MPEAPPPEKPNGSRHTVRLPGFTADTAVGLGDVIKKATTMAGIKPCGGCHERGQRLNRWMTINGRRPSQSGQNGGTG